MEDHFAKGAAPMLYLFFVVLVWSSAIHSAQACALRANSYNDVQIPADCKSDNFPAGQKLCVANNTYTVTSSWNSNGGSTVNHEKKAGRAKIARGTKILFAACGETVSPTAAPTVASTSTIAPPSPAPTFKSVSTEEVLKDLLADPGKQELKVETAYAKIVVHRINSSAQQFGNNTTIHVSGSFVKVVLPNSVTAALGDSTAAVIEAYKSASSVSGEFDSVPSHERSSFAGPPVAIRIWSDDGYVSVRDVAEPISIVILGNAGAAPRSTCKFWDAANAMWSSKGVQQYENAMGELVCVTTHLTIFAAIIDELLCANLNIFSSESLGRLGGGWALRPAAVLHWVFVAGSLGFLFVAVRADRCNHTVWSDTCLITDVPKEKQIPLGCDFCRSSIRSVTGGVSSAWRGCLRLSILVSSFSLLKTRILAFGVQAKLALKHGVSTRMIKHNVWGENGWILDGLALNSSLPMSSLLDDVRKDVPCAFKDFTSRDGFLRRTVLLFRLMHPLSQIRLLDDGMSSSKRAKLVMDALLGALVIAAVFFTSSGSVIPISSPEDCQARDQSFARYVLVGASSSLLVKLPIFFVGYSSLRSFVDTEQVGEDTAERQASWRRGVDATFWILGSALSLFCLVYLMIFVANLSSKDEIKWIACAFVVVLRIILVGPLCASLSFALFIELVLRQRPCITFLGDPSLGIDLCPKDNNVHPKVKELAGRGITVRDLFDFYKRLGTDVMPHFDPAISTTHCVVRQAIIPMSAANACSYSALVAGGNPRLASKMVTHNWSNKFAHLLAAIFADALGHRCYAEISEQMRSPTGMKALECKLKARSNVTYWICAFSVNQHAGICSTPPPRDAHEIPIQKCDCNHPKHRSGDECEMDKFDAMMAHLKCSTPGFCQVVAIDDDFALFGRIWCIAELLEARNSHILQSLKMPSEETLEEHKASLKGLDVRAAQASFSYDRDRILGKIDNVDSFNDDLRALLLHPSHGLFAAWSAGTFAGVAANLFVDGAMSAVVSETALDITTVI